MNLQDAVTVLRNHNTWRRGADTEQTNPKELGEALDYVCEAMQIAIDSKKYKESKR